MQEYLSNSIKSVENTAIVILDEKHVLDLKLPLIIGQHTRRSLVWHWERHYETVTPQRDWRLCKQWHQTKTSKLLLVLCLEVNYATNDCRSFGVSLSLTGYFALL